MLDEKPLVYLVLGAAGSGRREVVADLLANGLPERERAVVALSDRECAVSVEDRLPQTMRWRWRDGGFDLAPPEGAMHLVVVADGRGNPVDQMEAFKFWIDASGFKLARIITVVNCRLAAAHPEVLAWFDACVYFSDAVLLNYREGVANKWLSDFRHRYLEQCYPCLFEFVKKGRVGNPAEILDPQARRIAHLFDIEAPSWASSEEDGEDKDADDSDAEDVYLRRNLGGDRLKRIPDINTFLPPLEEG